MVEYDAKTNWQYDEVVTEHDQNRMEQGIADVVAQSNKAVLRDEETGLANPADLPTATKDDPGITQLAPAIGDYAGMAADAADVAAVAQSLYGRNMLRNADFRRKNSVVNQDGFAGTDADATGYFLDMWRGENLLATLANDHLNIKTKAGVADYKVLRQLWMTDEQPLIPGETYTASVLARCNSYSGTKPVFALATTNNGLGLVGATSMDISEEYRLYTQTITLPENWAETRWSFSLLAGGNAAASVSDIDIKRAKVEQGGRSTLLNDPPQNYGEQLRACQRYLVPLNVVGTGAGSWATVATGMIITTNKARITIPLTQSMRAFPSLAFRSGASISNITISVQGGNKSVISVTSVSFTATAVTFDFALSDSDNTVGAPVMLRINGVGGVYLDIRM